MEIATIFLNHASETGKNQITTEKEGIVRSKLD